MVIETQIKSLAVSQTKILEYSFSTAGHFEKWPKHGGGGGGLSCSQRTIVTVSPLMICIAIISPQSKKSFDGLEFIHFEPT